MAKILILFAAFICLRTNAQVPAINRGGGSFVPTENEDGCLSESARKDIQARLEASALKLKNEGRLVFSDDREDVQFNWPLQKAAGLEWNDYYGISNFVDQDPTAGLLDYHCDARTYDGHFGTDIFTWPFPWYLYENELVEVIAGEAGIIIEKDDGFEDDHCECFGSWNAVYVQHADGSVAWYGHMKSGTLTAKGIGEAVEQGEYLGVVASSGCSTGPHLHLEVYKAEVELIDPFSGDCNALNASSWWADQPENRTSRINVLLTHDEVPEHGCPTSNENPHFQNDFYLGDVLYTAVYFHDATAGSSTIYSIIDSEGELWNTWTANHDLTYSASWWWWSWSLPVDGPFGEWTFQGSYNGETVEHHFNYGVYAGMDEKQLQSVVLSPNPSTGVFKMSGMSETTHVKVYNSVGEQVRNQTIKPNGILNLSELSEGIYFVQFVVNNQLMSLKVVINKQ